jgi:hypothetical protein
MLKNFLISTALIVLPTIAMAQDDPAPSTPPPAVIVSPSSCREVPDELVTKLKNYFDLQYSWMTPIKKDENVIVQQDMYIEHTPDGDSKFRVVIILRTMLKDGSPVQQCLTNIGFMNDDILKKAKDSWEAYKKTPDAPDTPLTTPPSDGTVTTPKFQEAPSDE